MTAPYKSWTKEELDEVLDAHISEIGLSIRTMNGLEKKGIFLVRDLLNTTRREILAIPNFGEKTYAEVMDCLKRIGFY